MNQILFYIAGIALTPWKLVGFAGVILFSLRWCVQIFASHSAKKSVVPELFWYMSITGNILILLYFIFGRTDAVGILANLFPALVAFYNLVLVHREKQARKYNGSGIKSDTIL